MTYIVTWVKLPERKLMEKQEFDSLQDALDEADLAVVVGCSSIEIAVVDICGVQYFARRFDGVSTLSSTTA